MADLRAFHEDVEVGSSTAKIIGVVLIIAAVAAGGVYSYESGMWKFAPKPMVSSHDLPAPSLPRAVPPMAPPTNVPTPSQPASPIQ